MHGKILLCAGGTGGHVFPAIAMAEEFEAQGYAVHFITDTRAAKFLYDTHYNFDVVSAATFSGGIWGKVKCIFPLISGFFETIPVIIKQKPIAAIGFGGYPTVPPLCASFISGVPIFTHESNAILGLANILLAPFVKYIFTTHVETRGIKNWFKKKVRHTGNPVRAKIAALATIPFPSVTDKINIMIVGGSLGAKIFSGTVVEAVCALPSKIRSELNVIQQSRSEDIDRVKAEYKTAGITAIVKEFYNDMPEQLKTVHLLITRAGAGTITELTMAGRPAIYIPYPHNRDRQQYFNAEEVERAGGGWVMEEASVTAESLCARLKDILNHPETIETYGLSAGKLAMPDAAHTVFKLMIEKLNITS